MLTRHLILVALCPHCVFNRAYGGISKVIEHKMPPEGMVDRAPEMVAGGTVVGVEEGEGEGRITAVTIMTIMHQITEVVVVVVAQGGKSLHPHPDVVVHPNRLLLGMMVKVLQDSSVDSWIIDQLLQTQTALQAMQDQQLCIRAPRNLAFLLLDQVLLRRTCSRPRIDYGYVNVALLQLAGR